jgi:uncharacterized protein (DUF1684 family)
MSTDEHFERSLAGYRQARDRRLREPYGWLALVGRWQLEPGENLVDDGRAYLDHGAVRLVTARGEHAWPADEPPSDPYFFVGSKRYEVLRQGPVVILRARDPSHPGRTQFQGLRFFAPDVRWRVTAQLVPLPELLPVTLSTGMGGEDTMYCPGTLRFSLDGVEYHLDPLLESPSARKLFLLFKDATSGTSTYGAGRFLYVDLPDESGQVVVDFNRAFNPPCALTPHASCPVTPSQNRLPVAIEAGEMAPGSP